jgi:general secretion pathway protein M
LSPTLPMGLLGRLLALGLLFVMVAAVYALVAAPLMTLYAERAFDTETRRALLVKLKAVAEELPGLRQQVGQLRAVSASNKETLEGGSDAIALAALQGYVEKLASTAGMAIGSTESLPAEPQGLYRRLGLRLVLNGPYESFIKLLGALQAAKPPLVIDNLQIHSLQRRSGAPSAIGLDSSLEVYGFRADEIRKNVE